MPTLRQALNTASAMVREGIDIALAREVLEKVREIETEVVQSVVYDAYNPKIYERRGRNGGLGDPENIAGLTSNNKLEVYNIADPNHGGVFDFSRVTVAKSLSGLVEQGHEQYTTSTGRPGYDFTGKGKGAYLKPRPFMHETRNRLEETGAAREAVKQGLRALGFTVE